MTASPSSTFPSTEPGQNGDGDNSPSHGGKVENDHNKPKAGDQAPSQRNEARRTPRSRHDRESQLGSGNQVQSRRGGGIR